MPNVEAAAAPAPRSLDSLREFVTRAAAMIEHHRDEAALLEALGPALRRLVARDDWLPDELARPHPEHYQQYLLHADPLGRFSVVSFVWGPGQATPVHDHTVWGLIGLLRGAELSQRFTLDGEGRPVEHGEPVTLHPGEVEAVSPRLGDIHRVANGLADAASVSIHVYGANIGAVRRHVYAPDGERKTFVSGYANRWLPNLWGAP